MANQTIEQETLDNNVPADASVLYSKDGLTFRSTRAAFVGGALLGGGRWQNEGHHVIAPADGTLAMLNIAQTFLDAQTFQAALTANGGMSVVGDVNIAGKTASSSPDFPPLRAERTTTDNSGYLSAIDLLASTTANMVDGFGPLISLSVMDNLDVVNQLGAIGAARNGADNSGALFFFTRLLGAILERMRIEADGKVGINRPGTLRGQVDIDQASTSGAIPVIVLDQADDTQPFITLVSSIGAGKPIGNASIGTLYGTMLVNVGGVGLKLIPIYNP